MIEKIRKAGKFNSISFGQQQDPCESFFRKVMSSFQAATGRFGNGLEDYNIGVTVKTNMPMPGSQSDRGIQRHSTEESSSSDLKNVWLKSDNATLQSINPTTLAPVEISSNAKLHPDLKGPFTGAHSRTDPITGDWYNYNLEIGCQAVYRVFCVSAKTGKATILATVAGGDIRPAYLHSIMLTESYVIVCIFSAYYAMGGMKVLWTRNMLDALNFDPKQKNLWLVVDRLRGKGLVGMFKSDPFFAFHPVNAWEQPSETEAGKVDIITDIPVYENMDVLKRFYYHNMKSTSPSALNYSREKGSTSRASLTRFKLPSVGTTTITPTNAKTPVETLFTAPKHSTPELPSFNPHHATKPSRYIYGVSDAGYSTFLDGLLKYDTHTQTAVSRIIHAQSPGEPIFLPDPQGTEEDDGVLLSVVLDGTRGKSYLLCLDAKAFEELGRAEMESVVAFGFHGTHTSNL